MMLRIDWTRAAAAATALACCATAPAYAQDGGGQDMWPSFLGTPGSWYVGGAAGWNWPQDPNIYVPGTGPNAAAQSYIHGPSSARVNYNDSYVGLLSVGRSFGQPGYFPDLLNGLRLELEAGFRNGSVNAIDHLGPAVGQVQVWSGMVNAIYGLNLGSFLSGFGLKPYIGVGIGGADYATHNVHLSYAPGPASSASTTTFAFQGIAGVGYSVTPQLTVGLEYRYFATTDHPTGVSEGYHAQSALVSVRWAFGAPEEEHESMERAATYVPPPAPPPAPAVRNYLVFFNWNKSDLTSDARRIVDQAASTAKSGNSTRINATGYTDTSGSAAYNMRLSRRRAEAVAAELEAQGVPSDQIEVSGKGENDLLVPTGNGVREPQNRRVQIILGGSGPTS